MFIFNFYLSISISCFKYSRDSCLHELFHLYVCQLVCLHCHLSCLNNLRVYALECDRAHKQMHALTWLKSFKNVEPVPLVLFTVTWNTPVIFFLHNDNYSKDALLISFPFTLSLYTYWHWWDWHAYLAQWRAGWQGIHWNGSWNEGNHTTEAWLCHSWMSLSHDLGREACRVAVLCKSSS